MTTYSLNDWIIAAMPKIFPLNPILLINLEKKEISLYFQETLKRNKA